MYTFITIDGIGNSLISGNLLDSKDRKICSKNNSVQSWIKIGELSIVLNYPGLFLYLPGDLGLL